MSWFSASEDPGKEFTRIIHADSGVPHWASESSGGGGGENRTLAELPAFCPFDRSHRRAGRKTEGALKNVHAAVRLGVKEFLD